MIDADEVATPAFKEEVEKIVTDEKNPYSSYIVKYNYYFLGRYIRFGDPVKKLVLFRKSKTHFEKYDVSSSTQAEYLEIGHEHPIVDGRIGYIKTPILHHDNRTLYHYFDRHNRYSTWEAEVVFKNLYKDKKTLKVEGRAQGNLLEFRRLLKNIFLYMPFKTIIYFFYSYILRLGFLDGYPGLCYNICKSIYAYQIG